MALTFASLTLVYLCWESSRLALLYTGAPVAIIIAFRRYLARQAHPFAGTIGELQEDRACIRKES